MAAGTPRTVARAGVRRPCGGPGHGMTGAAGSGAAEPQPPPGCATAHKAPHGAVQQQRSPLAAAEPHFTSASGDPTLLAAWLALARWLWHHQFLRVASPPLLFSRCDCFSCWQKLPPFSSARCISRITAFLTPSARERPSASKRSLRKKLNEISCWQTRC